jgi:PAS domain S-box-containing protein
MTREIELASASARKSAQETERQRAWLGALLERLSAGVLGFDQEGRLRIANRAAEAILGIGAAQYIGRRLADLERELPELASFTEPLARHLRGGLREWREELVVDTTDGRRVLMLPATSRCSTISPCSIARSAMPPGAKSRAGSRTRSRIR